ncbi:hypothetical protein TNCV_1216891 [Trichonephila clavipes]|nr:hypothetical protein TNCV_1216891 [Trichonephila clavipes]
MVVSKKFYSIKKLNLWPIFLDEDVNSTTAKRKIIHSVKKDLRVSASKLALSMSSTIGEKITDETIRHTLHQYGFHGRTPI